MHKDTQSFAIKMTYWLKVVSLGLILGLGLQFAQAWTAPTVAPLGGNVAGPLTVGSAGQTKAGNLALNSDGVYVNALLIPNGNVGIGTLNPTQKLDVNGNIAAFGLYDKANPSYFLWPSGNNYLKKLYVNGTAANPDISAVNIYVDGSAMYSLSTYGPNSSTAKSLNGSMNVNDIYLRSKGMWASDIAGGSGTVKLVSESSCNASHNGEKATGLICPATGSPGGGEYVCNAGQIKMVTCTCGHWAGSSIYIWTTLGNGMGDGCY